MYLHVYNVGDFKVNAPIIVELNLDVSFKRISPQVLQTVSDNQR